MLTCMWIGFFTIQKCYLAVGQKHLKKPRVSTLHLSSPKLNGCSPFPLLLLEFQSRQLSRSYSLTWLVFFLPPSTSLCDQSPFAKRYLFCCLAPAVGWEKLYCLAFLYFIQGGLHEGLGSLYCQLRFDPHPQLQFHMDMKKVQTKQIKYSSRVRFTACMGVSSPSQLCSISWEFDIFPQMALWILLPF